MTENAKIKWTPWLIFIISFVVLMLCQYTPAIIDYEARFVVFAQNALTHGLTYFPVINGQPYPDYPIGNTFLLYLFALPFGKVSIFSLSIPYCIAGALTMLATYKIAAIHDRRWGIYAVLFSFLTWQYLYDLHNIAVDIYPVLAAVWCFYLVYSADITGATKRLWFLPLLLLLGLFARGPIGLIIPAVVVGVFYLFSKNWRALFIFGIVSITLLILGFGLLLGGAYLQGGKPFMHEVFLVESIGRITNYHKSHYAFYFTIGLLPYVFTVLFAIAVIIRKFKDIVWSKTRIDKLLQYLLVWILIIILGFTVPHSKQARYILAITPAIALLAGYIFINDAKFFIKARNVLTKLCLFMPLLGLIMIAGALIHNHFAATPWQGYFMLATIMLAILLVTNILVRIYCHKRLPLIVLGIIAFLVISVLLLQPMIMYHKILSEPLDQVIFLPYF